MSKYATGGYLVSLFDRLGTKIKTITADSVLDGQAIGEAAVGRAEAHSFVVLRVIYNSATPRLENYDVRKIV